MPDALSCPDPARLRRLLNGLEPLGDREATLLEHHLRECGRCEHLAESAAGGDTLVEALAGGGTRHDGPLPPPVDRLVERFKNLPAPAEQATRDGSRTESPQNGGGPAAGAPEEALRFLRPPEAPGEIGRLGHYRVLRQLGRGGMGVVLLGEDTLLQRPVALKAMLPSLAAHPAARERFLREARAAARIKHDHVVTIHQVGEQSGVPYLAMELLDGESLEDRLHREGRLPTGEVVRIGREMAEALQAAHESGLIHRDIKPANVWLESRTTLQRAGRAQARVKVLDFGLARGSGDSQVTAQGAILGTPAYMAPEQARGEAVDHRSDLFSLGCVLYRTATGELPFKGKDAFSTLTALAVHQPSPPRQTNPDVPVPLDRLITRLLNKDPGQRPPSAAAVARALQLIEETPTAPPAQTPPTQAAPVRAARRGRLLAVAAVAGVLLGGLLMQQVIVRIKGKDGKVKQEIPLQQGETVEVVNGPAGEPLPFFDGKTLEGWEGDTRYWKVEKGAIVGRGWREAYNTFLCSKKKYRDFELRFRGRLRGGKGNSGVQIRSEIMDRAKFTVKGPQADMGDDYWGSLYGEHFGGMMKRAPADVVKKALKPAGFNDYFIRCVGKHVTIKLNGETTVDDDFETMPAEGIIAWQLHGGHPDMEVEFRDVRFKDLRGGDDAGLRRVRPGRRTDIESTPAPKGATVLFDGKNLRGWVNPDTREKAHWALVRGGAVRVTPGGNIATVRNFGGSFRLHVEFRVPDEPGKTGQARGNSGVYLQGRYEVQILDSYGLKSDSTDCGGIYGVAAPRVNACKAPGVWQSFDIDFVAPKCKAGKLAEPARLTVYHNGVKIHDNVQVAKETGLSLGGDPCEPGPVMLQDHGSPVEFRNIWLLPGRAGRGRE
jgi:hypothetical protein